MKINTSTDYAIRILICLAKAGHVVSSSQLSQDLNISSRYVLLVLAKLQNADMVNAAYGCAGGYTLAYDPGEINIQNVIHVMEGIHLIESSENSMFAIYINNYNNAIRNLSCALEKMTLKDFNSAIVLLLSIVDQPSGSLSVYCARQSRHRLSNKADSLSPVIRKNFRDDWALFQ